MVDSQSETRRLLGGTARDKKITKFFTKRTTPSERSGPVETIPVKLEIPISDSVSSEKKRKL